MVQTGTWAEVATKLTVRPSAVFAVRALESNVLDAVIRISRTTFRKCSFCFIFFKVEQVEQVADGRHVARHIGLATVLNGIGQIISTAFTERGVEHPVPFDELNDGGMLGIGVADMAASREG
jgi:hypothetical protein